MHPKGLSQAQALVSLPEGEEFIFSRSHKLRQSLLDFNPGEKIWYYQNECCFLLPFLSKDLKHPAPSPHRVISSILFFFFKCFLVKLEYAMKLQSFVAEI